MKKAGLTPDAVETAMLELGGNLAAVARRYGCSRQAVHDYVRRRARLLSAARDVREGMKDNAESALLKAILAGEGWAIRFFLRTQAKDRGYGDTVKVLGA